MTTEARNQHQYSELGAPILVISTPNRSNLRMQRTHI